MLLTERSHDLTDYPGQIVFPGGAAEPDHGGPVATELREAMEETGLDINQVHVIGCLPALALPDTGFLVHPVLAWSEHATFPGSVNYSEVAARFEIAVCQLADRDPTAPMARGGGRGPMEPCLLGTVTSAVIDMLLARLHRGEPSQGPAQVNKHPEPGSAPLSALSGTPDVRMLSGPQRATPRAHSPVSGPR